MGLLGRFRRRGPEPFGRSDGPGMSIDLESVYLHFAHFAQTRRGVEAFIEPSTQVSPQSMVLVATDGEWTRRAVGSRPACHDIAGRLGIPAYDVLLTGYPPRMREWTSRQRRAQRDDTKGTT
jgi:hypothetical protein